MKIKQKLILTGIATTTLLLTQTMSSAVVFAAEETPIVAVLETENPVVPVEPTPVEPTPVEPTPVEPTPVEPAPVEPTPVEPTPVEPTPVEPAPVEPAPVDPPSIALQPIQSQNNQPKNVQRILVNQASTENETPKEDENLLPKTNGENTQRNFLLAISLTSLFVCGLLLKKFLNMRGEKSHA